MKLLEDLYVYPWLSSQENNANTIFIDGEVPTLIDPGHAHLFSHVIQGAARDGIVLEASKLIICTHGHPDHMEAVGRFDSDIITAVSRREYEYLQDEGRDLFMMTGSQVPRGPFGLLLTEGSLLLGKKRFQVLSTPGHSPGSICLYWEDQRVLLSGDTLFYLGVGRTDLPGGDSHILAESISRLAKLDIEYLVPGHGEVVKGKNTIEKNFQMILREFFSVHST
ncbi:MAG: MBL fold metallo-hydrolase [Syntrophorhabdales bacterium]|jgi:glyoxylase-like metal-dependent hydrolase (beta-lactamase superfamily II)